MNTQSFLQYHQLVERIQKDKEDKKMSWGQIARNLYQILDNIHTASERNRRHVRRFMESVLQINARRNQASYTPTLQRVTEELANSQEVIPLTNSQLRAMVDPEDYKKVSSLSWFLKTDKRTNVHYVAHSQRIGEKVKTLRLHRIVVEADSSSDVHHKDQNPLNCHKDNLEVISKEEHRNFHTKRNWQPVCEKNTWTAFVTWDPNWKEGLPADEEIDVEAFDEVDAQLKAERALKTDYAPGGRIVCISDHPGGWNIRVSSKPSQKDSIKESDHSEWARKELQLAGLFDKDSDYEGMIGEAVMDLVDKFSEQGHSGFSASYVTSIFDQLIRWKPLTELTDDPDEWMLVKEDQDARTPGKIGKTKVYQSRRSPDCFSEDGGLTYYSIDDSCFEGVEPNGVTYMHYCPENWAKVTIHTTKKRE